MTDLSMINDRDPWDLLRRAEDHIRQQMSVVRSVCEDNGWRIKTDQHMALCEAHSRICTCRGLIADERYPKSGAA